MSRKIRQAKIIDIISTCDIETQDELCEKLKEGGLVVTQATVSRDIKELALSKTISKNGKYVYTQHDDHDKRVSQKVLNMFKEAVISIKHSNNIIVIKTLPASAQAAAVAVDRLAYHEVLGCVAGDDTLFLVVDGNEKVKAVIEKLSQIIY